MKKWITAAICGLIIFSFITLGVEDGIGSLVLFGFVLRLMWSKNKPKQMTGLEFEKYCAKELIKRGYKNVTVTPASGDYGADIVATDRKGQRWVFQCKHYQGNVSNSAVQEAVAAKAHYKADRAAVMTNSQLTKKARELAWENAVELFEGLSD